MTFQNRGENSGAPNTRTSNVLPDLLSQASPATPPRHDKSSSEEVCFFLSTNIIIIITLKANSLRFQLPDSFHSCYSNQIPGYSICFFLNSHLINNCATNRKKSGFIYMAIMYESNSSHSDWLFLFDLSNLCLCEFVTNLLPPHTVFRFVWLFHWNTVKLVNEIPFSSRKNSANILI